MAINKHFTPAWSQRDEILVLHEQTAAVRHVDCKWAKRVGMKQFSNFVRFHALKITQPGTSASGKRPPRFNSGGSHDVRAPACARLSSLRWGNTSRFLRR